MRSLVDIKEETMTPVVEFLPYRLKPGCGAAFHTLIAEQSVPLYLLSGLIILRYGNPLWSVLVTRYSKPLRYSDAIWHLAVPPDESEDIWSPQTTPCSTRIRTEPFSNDEKEFD